MGKVKIIVTEKFTVELPCMMDVWNYPYYEGKNKPVEIIDYKAGSKRPWRARGSWWTNAKPVEKKVKTWREALKEKVPNKELFELVCERMWGKKLDAEFTNWYEWSHNETSFSWKCTKEGSDFWHAFDEALRGQCDFPKIPKMIPWNMRDFKNFFYKRGVVKHKEKELYITITGVDMEKREICLCDWVSIQEMLEEWAQADGSKFEKEAK